MITKVTTDELRKMRGKEGLVFQGCSPPLSEWKDGINEILTREGILRGGSAFENVMEFENRGVTNLLFPFDGAACPLADEKPSDIRCDVAVGLRGQLPVAA